jgi:hypothetical protein
MRASPASSFEVNFPLPPVCRRSVDRTRLRALGRGAVFLTVSRSEQHRATRPTLTTCQRTRLPHRCLCPLCFVPVVPAASVSFTGSVPFDPTKARGQRRRRAQHRGRERGGSWGAQRTLPARCSVQGPACRPPPPASSAARFLCASGGSRAEGGKGSRGEGGGREEGRELDGPSSAIWLCACVALASVAASTFAHSASACQQLLACSSIAAAQLALLLHSLDKSVQWTCGILPLHGRQIAGHSTDMTDAAGSDADSGSKRVDIREHLMRTVGFLPKGQTTRGRERTRSSGNSCDRRHCKQLLTLRALPLACCVVCCRLPVCRCLRLAVRVSRFVSVARVHTRD